MSQGEVSMKREVLDGSLKSMALNSDFLTNFSLHGLGISVDERFNHLSSILQCSFPTMGLLVNLRSSPVHAPSAYNNNADTVFSGKSEFAIKCREHATMNYILDGDKDKYDQALQRVKHLFDYSEHFDKSPSEEAYKKYYHITQSFQAIRDAFGPIWDALKFVNEFGVSFELNERRELRYQHPNDDVGILSAQSPVFEGDMKLLEDKLIELCEQFGLSYTDFNEEDYVNENLRIAERIRDEVLRDDFYVVKLSDHTSVRKGTWFDRHATKGSTHLDFEINQFPSHDLLTVKNGEVRAEFHYRHDVEEDSDTPILRCTGVYFTRYTETKMAGTMRGQILVRDFIKRALGLICIPYVLEPQEEENEA